MTTALVITELPIAELLPYFGNARVHSPKQISEIAASIQAFGFNNPVLIDGSGTIIAGHGRVTAAKQLGMDTVPCVRLEHLSEAQKRAYILADNRLAEKAGWDWEILKIELQHLCEVETEFDVTITGFEMAEIDLLLGGSAPADDPADVVPTVGEGPAVTRPGDLWSVGRHRLICGDATDPETVARLMEGERAQMVFTDPPYNVKIDGHVSGLGSRRHREFAVASGEMTPEAFTAFLARAFESLARSSCDGAIAFVCMDWRHLPEVLAAGGQAFTELKNICVWTKSNGGMGSLYRSQHEMVLVYKSGTRPHINNIELGRHGRYRTNVWAYPGANGFGAARDGDLAMHPTVKPVALVADAILDCSRPRGIVLDGFAGSGTTLVAAERTGRRGYGVELDPAYCDTILKRLEAVVGEEARLVATGQTFAEVAADRSGAGALSEVSS